MTKWVPRPPFTHDDIEEMLKQTLSVHEELKLFAESQINNVLQLMDLNERYKRLRGETGSGGSPTTGDPPEADTTVPDENAGGTG
jgi:hypothetical protein